ncbi:MAG: Zn-dependent oligopeptidase [Candidatus Niyogibacteria bacterium]|nr:Zn-dependent oligopeptidase [Candidatus Niyogibacteria bacterium]
MKKTSPEKIARRHGDFGSVTPDDIRRIAAETFAAANAIRDEALSFTGPRTVANTLDPFEDLLIALTNASNLSFLRHVHPRADIRQAAERLQLDTQVFLTSVFTDSNLYGFIRAVDASAEDPETRRFHEKTLEDFLRSGADKDEKTRIRISELLNELTRLGQEFDRNIQADVPSISMAVHEADGLPDPWKEAHPIKDGKIDVSTQYSDLIPFMKYAHSAEARRRLYHENLNRAPGNEAVFHQIMKARQELARLLGHATYADYATEDKMTGSSAAVRAFLDHMDRVTREPARRDHEALLREKQKDHPGATEFHPWEVLYYEERLRQSRFASNAFSFEPYFEYGRVRDVILAMTGALFGVSFVLEDAPVWHPDVQCYAVYAGKKLLGRFYLDMHPRADKYTHAMCVEIFAGIRARQIPEAVLVCNFQGGAEHQGPALLQYEDVETFLHEFGHVLHFIFGGGVRRFRLSGFNVEWDFVEAPSQMLEELLSDENVLRTMTRHHETGEPVPRDAARKMIAAREIGKGSDARRQVSLALYSLETHMRDAATLDLEAMWRDMCAQFSFTAYPDGTHFWWSFGHLNEYSALYYTYLWSSVIAKDLWTAFRPKPLDSAVAARYRAMVLEPAGTKNAALLVSDFLGRPYSFDAFAEWLRTVPNYD